MSMLSNTEVKLEPRAGISEVKFKDNIEDKETGPRPFVKERQDVILKIFKAVDSSIKPWSFE